MSAIYANPSKLDPNWECYLCLGTLRGRAIIPHNDPLGRQHPVHRTCLLNYLKFDSRCGVCRAKIDPTQITSSSEKSSLLFGKIKVQVKGFSEKLLLALQSKPGVGLTLGFSGFWIFSSPLMLGAGAALLAHDLYQRVCPVATLQNEMAKKVYRKTKALQQKLSSKEEIPLSEIQASVQALDLYVSDNSCPSTLQKAKEILANWRLKGINYFHSEACRKEAKELKEAFENFSKDKENAAKGLTALFYFLAASSIFYLYHAILGTGPSLAP